MYNCVTYENITEHGYGTTIVVLDSKFLLFHYTSTTQPQCYLVLSGRLDERVSTVF